MKILSEPTKLTEEEIMEEVNKQNPDKKEEVEDSPELKALKDDHKYIVLAYRLISEGMHQGKNTYMITDTLEFLEKTNKVMHEEIVKMMKNEGKIDEK